MIRKIITILIVGFFLLNGINAVAYDQEETTNNNSFVKNSQIHVSKPEIIEKEKFLQIKLPEQTTYLFDQGKPILPVITKTLTFPIGTIIEDTTVTFSQEKHSLTNQIEPSPKFVPIGYESQSNEQLQGVIDESVYSSSNLYPSEKYTVKKSVGLYNDERVVFVTTHCYSQYNPKDNILYTPDSIDIQVEYQPPTEPLFTENLYDMLIVTTEKFVESLQPLVDHKNSVGIQTKIETVENIIEKYNGVDDWEDVKLCIKDSIENFGITYVLLAGGHKGQTNEWWVPDFRSHNWDPATAYDPPYDETYASDLYFADIYKYNDAGSPLFDDWDTNNNGIYAEGPKLNPGSTYDEPDYIPDVYLGRLPIRYSWEVPIVVDKIINYENTADDSWFKTSVLAGGDGFPPERYGNSVDANAWEGEIVCDAFANLLSNKDFESTKCYCSDQGDVVVEDSDDVYNEVTKGCGIVHFTGHASPMVLGSYKPKAGVSPPHLIPFYSGFNVRQFDNEYKLPFMINEGCHNAQFDVTGQELLEYFLSEDNSHILLGRNEWIPHDASSWFVLQEGGGAIGVIGNTGLGLGGIDNWCTDAVGGWMMLRFAHAFAIQDKQHTGTVWAQGITDYVNNWPVLTDDGDRKTIEERALIGDPSVKLGGYQLDTEPADDDDTDQTIDPVSLNVPTWQIGNSWTYHLEKIDIDLAEVEGRSIDFTFETGEIIFEITEDTGDEYIAKITSDNMKISLDLLFDFYMEEKDPLVVPETNLHNVSLQGVMNIDKSTLGINSVDISLELDIGENLEGLPIELPSFVSILKPYISIPAIVDINVDFEHPYPLLQFPLETGEFWGISESLVYVNIDGSVESIWLRLVNILNKFVQVIPPEFAKYLPKVDISEVLNDFGIQTEYEMELSEMTQIEDSPLFEVKGKETVETNLDTFDTAAISILEGNGDMYFSESVKNVVKITSPISEYVPIFNDINLELVDYSIE
ncbi:MAG TPA: C25 family cysteine peptidase [Candidatus Thermoplasmatota archaeon]|nr:C25 family cysteine peptidase [Candidatus Thermoplasmatota archaeon]